MMAEKKRQISRVANLMRRELGLSTPVDPIGAFETLGGTCEKADTGFQNAYAEITRNRNGTDAVILYKKDLDEDEARFAVAKETGRLVLYMAGRHGGETGTEPVRLDRTPLYSEENALCEQFAAELLMPEDEFREACSGSKIRIGDLAAKFGVSKHAARTRGYALGLF